MTEQDEKELFAILKRNLPNGLAFRTEGGLQGRTEVLGTLEDFLCFVRSVHEEGVEYGYSGVSKL